MAQSPSSLFRLPRELRDLIYDLLIELPRWERNINDAHSDYIDLLQSTLELLTILRPQNRLRCRMGARRDSQVIHRRLQPLPGLLAMWQTGCLRVRHELLESLGRFTICLSRAIPDVPWSRLGMASTAASRLAAAESMVGPEQMLPVPIFCNLRSIRMTLAFVHVRSLAEMDKENRNPAIARALLSLHEERAWLQMIRRICLMLRDHAAVSTVRALRFSVRVDDKEPLDCTYKFLDSTTIHKVRDMTRSYSSGRADDLYVQDKDGTRAVEQLIRRLNVLRGCTDRGLKEGNCNALVRLLGVPY